MLTEISFLTNFHLGFNNTKSDILIHLTQWQYWWWFWFSYLWALYFLLLVRVFRFRVLKFKPRIVTSYRPHGKWGDLIVCLIPVSWCVNIITNSNFILRMIEWQAESSLFTIRIRGKQWYWVYKFELKVLTDIISAPKNIGNNKWVINTPGELQLADDYLHIVQLRSQNKWVKTYWGNFFERESRPDATKVSTPQQKLRYDFLNKKIEQDSMIKFNEQNVTFFDVNDVIFDKDNFIDLDLDKSNEWNFISHYELKELIPVDFTQFFEDGEFVDEERMADVLIDLIFDDDYWMMFDDPKRTILHKKPYIEYNSLPIISENEFLNLFDLSDLDVLNTVDYSDDTFDHFLDQFDMDFMSDLNDEFDAKIENYQFLDRDFTAVFFDEDDVDMFEEDDSYSDHLLYQQFIADMENQEELDDLNFSHSDHPETSRWVKRGLGTKLPIRVIKLPMKYVQLDEEDSNDLFRVRFNNEETAIEHKTIPHSTYWAFKQKRYKRKKIVLPRNKYHRNKDGSFSKRIKNTTKPLLKDNKIILDTNENLSVQYKTYKKNKIKSENVALPLSKRMLRTKRILVLPAHVNLTAITNSYDVVHSWFIPGLGLKMDCVPGRATHHVLHIDNVGFYYGQCAEICGRYHHHMPIRLCALPFEHFLLWWHTFGLPKLLFTNDQKKYSVTYGLRKFTW